MASHVTTPPPQNMTTLLLSLRRSGHLDDVVDVDYELVAERIGGDNLARLRRLNARSDFDRESIVIDGMLVR